MTHNYMLFKQSIAKSIAGGFIFGTVLISGITYCMFQEKDLEFKKKSHIWNGDLKVVLNNMKGGLGGHIDHIIKPYFTTNSADIGRIYIKKTRWGIFSLNSNNWYEYNQHVKNYCETKKINQSTIDMYQNLSYNIIDLNCKILTRILLEKEKKLHMLKEPEDKYYLNIGQDLTTDPQKIKLLQKYEEILKKLIENNIIRERRDPKITSLN